LTIFSPVNRNVKGVLMIGGEVRESPEEIEVFWIKFPGQAGFIVESKIEAMSLISDGIVELDPTDKDNRNIFLELRTMTREAFEALPDYEP
jgi:hypothetical protein